MQDGTCLHFPKEDEVANWCDDVLVENIKYVGYKIEYTTAGTAGLLVVGGWEDRIAGVWGRRAMYLHDYDYTDYTIIRCETRGSSEAARQAPWART